MKNKIETLKDISISSRDFPDVDGAEVKLISDVLKLYKARIKAEAMKWVNKHRDKLWNWTEDTWMDFFNITEEDLKKKENEK